MDGQPYLLTIRCPACGVQNNVRASTQTLEPHKDWIFKSMTPGFVCRACAKTVSIANCEYVTREAAPQTTGD
jgi:hypothetical protein